MLTPSVPLLIRARSLLDLHDVPGSIPGGEMLWQAGAVLLVVLVDTTSVIKISALYVGFTYGGTVHSDILR